MRSDVFLDDKDQLTHVSFFKSWWEALGRDSFGLFRPVKNFLYYGFHVYGKPAPFVWHWINLSVYLASIISVQILTRRVTGSAKWGFVATALWATSATQASTAIWMSCINISLAIVLACTALVFHDRSWGGGTQIKTITATLAFSFLAQNSYETAICIGPLCVLFDLFRNRPIFSKQALFRYGALIAVTLAFLFIRKSLGAVHNAENANLGFAPDMPAWQLSVSAPWMLWKHFSMWFSPSGRIEFISTYVWGLSASLTEIALAWGFLGLLVTAVIGLRKRLPLVAFGLAWFLLASFPASNFVPVRAGPIEDYYLVFPGVGLALALTGLLQAALARISVPASAGKIQAVLQPSLIIFFLLVVVLSRGAGLLLFRHLAGLWNDPLGLYLTCAETRPAQFQNKALAARELLLAGQLEMAKQLASEAEQEGPWYAVSSMLLGEIAQREGDHVRALEYYERGRTQISSKGPIYQFCNLRIAQTLMRDPANFTEARKTLLPILADPKSDYHYNATLALTHLYAQEGNSEKALQTLNKSLALHPGKAGEIEIVMAKLKAGQSNPENSGSEAPVQR